MFKSMQLIVHYFNLEIYTCIHTMILSSSSSFSAHPPFADNGVRRVEFGDLSQCYGSTLYSSPMTYANVRELL